MKKTIFPALLAILLLAACTAPKDTPPEKDASFTLAATTYPVYLYASAIAEGVEGVEVSLVINQQTSCLHDYTLTVRDMKTLESADVIALSGVGLESFMDDALKTSAAAVIDCSAGIALLQTEDGTDDPHYWMDPNRAAQAVDNLEAGMSALDPDHAEVYRENAQKATTLLHSWNDTLLEYLVQDQGTAPENRNLITFHDGFQYFANAFGFTLLKAIEEEEGSEASAQEITEIVSLIQEYDLPVIFTERNGSDATAQAISRETGVTVEQLTMIMSGEEHTLGAYLDAQLLNAKAIINGFAGQEIMKG